MRASEEINELAAALSAAQGEFTPVAKGAENPFFHSRYADLAAVVQATAPILAKHGLSVAQMPDFDGENDLLTTRLMHTSGQWLESTMRLYVPKATPQAQGSAVTYARRYSYSGTLGIVTEKDDDGEGAKGGDIPSSRRPSSSTRPPSNGQVSEAQLRMIRSIGNKLGFAGPLLKKLVADTIGHDVAHLADLTGGRDGEASQVITALKAKEANGEMAPAAQTDDPGPQEPPEGWIS